MVVAEVLMCLLLLEVPKEVQTFHSAEMELT
jgi:hypothetical protein